MTAPQTATQAPMVILGDLTPGNAVGVRPTIPSVELRVDDTLYAAGFSCGGSRRVLEIRFVSVPGERLMYVRVAEGWYRWTRVYANVRQF
jgi:hypothetical protein